MKFPIRPAILHKTLLICGILFLFTCIWFGTLSEKLYIKLIAPPATLYLILTLVRRLFFFSGALHDKILKSKRLEIDKNDIPWPFVSIIVPAYNEERVIADSIRSLLKLNYTNYEVIVVDDGSSDHTYLYAQCVAESSPRINVRVIRKSNGGKASALNEGLRFAAGDLVLCCDADSVITEDSLIAAVPHFIDDRVGAVAGFVEIINTSSWLLKFQQYEYMVGLNFLRRGMSVLGVVPIVPGPAGLFRKAAIEDVGGFHTDRTLFAEDAELSLRIVTQRWIIVSEEDFVALTEAPNTWRDLLRQRYRWSRGVFQAYRLNLSKLLDSGGWRGRLLATFIFSEIYWVTFVNMGLILMFLTHWLIHGHTDILTPMYFGIIMLEMLSAVMVSYKDKRPLRWTLVALFASFSYSLILVMWKVFSLYEEWISAPMSWDKIERRGLKDVA